MSRCLFRDSTKCRVGGAQRYPANPRRRVVIYAGGSRAGSKWTAGDLHRWDLGISGFTNWSSSQDDQQRSMGGGLFISLRIIWKPYWGFSMDLPLSYIISNKHCESVESVLHNCFTSGVTNQRPSTINHQHLSTPSSVLRRTLRIPVMTSNYIATTCYRSHGECVQIYMDLYE